MDALSDTSILEISFYSVIPAPIIPIIPIL